MLIVYLFLSALLVAVDQWYKYWIVSNLALHQTKEIIPGWFSITHIRNTGAAWSVFEGQMAFFFVITVAAVAIIGYLLYKNYRENHVYSIGLSLILAGAIGNFIDRMRLGYVVDMFQLDFIKFPIFNIADVLLFCGVFCVFVYLLFEERIKGSQHAK